MTAALCRVIALPAHEREHRTRLVAGLFLQALVVDRPAIDARRCARLETAPSESK